MLRLNNVHAIFEFRDIIYNIKMVLSEPKISPHVGLLCCMPKS